MPSGDDLRKSNSASGPAAHAPDPAPRGSDRAECASDPAVSVIIPAWNAEEYLEQAVRSARRQQVPLEILIIDDGSTDRTGELADALSDTYPDIIRVFHLEADMGVAAARNVGIREAKGRYLAFLDADDWWEEGKLSAQLSLLEKSGAVLCASARELMNPDGSAAGRIIGVPERISYEMLLHGNVIACSSVLIRTEAAREFGFERDDLHEDYILWLRVLKKYGDAAGINAPYLKSRLSKGGKSRDKRKSAKMTYGVYRYLGFGRIRAAYYFLHYAVSGLRKYYG